MNTEKTKIEKLESEIDAFKNLWHRRPYISLLVLLIILLPIIFLVIDKIFIIPELKKSNKALIADKAKLQKELNETITARDKFEVQLAPFLATANLKFQNVEPDKRLDLLAQKMDEVIDTVQNATDKIFSQRVIPENEVNKLIDNLKKCKFPLKTIIKANVGDQESSKLTLQIRDIFKKGGWKATYTKQAIFSNIKKGIDVRLYQKPTEDIQKALLPLFDGLGYKREIRISKKIEPDTLEIWVYSK